MPRPTIYVNFSLSEATYRLNLNHKEPLSGEPFFDNYKKAQKFHLPVYSIALVILKPKGGETAPSFKFYDSNRLIEAITDRSNVLDVSEGTVAPKTNRTIQSVHHFALPCFRLEIKDQKTTLRCLTKNELPKPILLTAEKIEIVRGYFAAVNLAYIQEMIESKSNLQRHLAVYKARLFQKVMEEYMQKEGTQKIFETISAEQVKVWKKCGKWVEVEDISALEQEASMLQLLKKELY